MTTPCHAVAAILSGPLAHRAQGFLLVLPPGATGRAAMAQGLDSTYGSTVHPDVLVLESDVGGPARIDDVRRALAFAHTHPAGRGLKTLWVPEADAMSPQAANAFLKTLEEPSSSTRVILGSSRPERLLPTTRSRCLMVSARHDAALARAELETIHPGAGDSIDAALNLTDGAIDAAARLLSAKDGMSWAKATHAALGKGTILPIPTGGAQGIDAPTAGLVVHVALARALRLGVAGTEARIDAAAPYLADLVRPGMDLGTRMRALARGLAAA